MSWSQFIFFEENLRLISLSSGKGTFGVN